MPKTVVTTDRLMKPIAHFSHGVRVGDVIHLGAAAGTDPQQRLAGRAPGVADMTAQTERLFDNFEVALRLLGGALRDVVRFRSFVADWRDLASYDEVHRRRFGGWRPSTATLGTWGFPLPHATVEAELIAVVGGAPRQLASGVRAGSHHWYTASPSDDRGALLGGFDAGAQTEHALRRLATALDAGGLGVRDVVMVNVSLADLRHYPAFEAAYARFFPPPYPARTVVATSLRHPAQIVEIESTAVAGGGRAVSAGLSAAPGVSPAMLAGDELYIGGQLGVTADGSLPADPEQQTRAAWTRVQALLEEAGMALEDVVRTSNVLTDWRNYASYNTGYGAFVAAPYPPRATVVGALADPRAVVQIEAVAHRAGRDATVLEANPPFV
jgi:2-iminobutanoate/2-iminopropanoate deaminase